MWTSLPGVGHYSALLFYPPHGLDFLSKIVSYVSTDSWNWPLLESERCECLCLLITLKGNLCKCVPRRMRSRHCHMERGGEGHLILTMNLWDRYCLSPFCKWGNWGYITNFNHTDRKWQTIVEKILFWHYIPWANSSKMVKSNLLGELLGSFKLFSSPPWHLGELWSLNCFTLSLLSLSLSYPTSKAIVSPLLKTFGTACDAWLYMGTCKVLFP